MFDNIGGKIKGLAKVICWINIIVCIIVGLLLIQNSIILGFLIIVIGSLLAWVGSFILYGFGQLIENSDRLVYNKNINRQIFSNNSDQHSNDSTTVLSASIKKSHQKSGDSNLYQDLYDD